ncbi:hypothetical protein [Amnibacterium endophyticum]|uniref:Uncharacterized protein n=1 Tax=Amnibacterium endophyticum TaxID=2109337 RepID=A0ABW4LGC2_9MICO
MSMLPALVLASAEHHELVAPSVIFPLIAVGVFLLLGAVTWSYRDVAHRHADKGRTRGAGQGQGH